MLFTTFAFLVAAASAASLLDRQLLAVSQVCSQIAGNITGQVLYSSEVLSNFNNDTEHWMSSSSQTPACVVEVANTQDVSNVLKIVGSTRTPFAVKSGGHASNQGFSSTTGVFISLVRIKQVNLSTDKSTVEIGLGNIWSDVYTALNGSGVNVVGGRVPGPGTGGFTLGGGFSWLTDQYGLTCDTVKSYQLVLPNGTITTVDSTKSDLFFALKGGLNRFGIVTSIVYNTVPQPNLVYGGIQIFASTAVPALIAATETFQSTNKDPKAQVILTINGGTVSEAILILFYDAPIRPSAFNPYNNIPALVSTLKVQTFASFASGTPSQLQAGSRGAFATISTTTLTTKFMDAVYNESSYYGALAVLETGTFLSYDIEPFLNYGQYATDSAYPHSNSPLPLNVYFAWQLAADDSYWQSLIQQSINTLTAVAKSEGIFLEGVYPNYALSTTSSTQLYGATNAARLRSIQANYDPNGVMELTGGFKL